MMKETTSPIMFRTHRPGDMGWVVHRHGALYAQEYGWDERFEALVAQIAADFINNYNPKRERAIIAERGGETLGFVFVVQESESVAKLRMLLVEPSARGLGLGKRLVQEAVDFARTAGYRKMILWTTNILDSARHIYKTAGFKVVEEFPDASFGQDVISETWELIL